MMQASEKEASAISAESQDNEISMDCEKINYELRHHQQSIKDWDHQTLAKDIHIWTKRFCLEFKLQCPPPAISLEDLQHNCHGHFRIGRNGFGILNEIAINISYILGDMLDYDNLGTLLHELIHAEQQALGTDGRASRNRNYHNAAFIERAKGFGLIVDHKGHQQYVPPPTRFSNLLAQYGIQLPESVGDGPLKNKSRGVTSGNSKLKPWICDCKPRPIHVQVAVQDFRARCLKCGELFRQKQRTVS